MLPHLKQSSPETVVLVTAQRFPLDTFLNHNGMEKELQIDYRIRDQPIEPLTPDKQIGGFDDRASCEIFLSHQEVTVTGRLRSLIFKTLN